MKFHCTITQHDDNRWRAVCEDAQLGRVTASGDSPEDTVSKLKDELRYRLELCPCTGESYQHIVVEVETHR